MLFQILIHTRPENFRLGNAADEASTRFWAEVLTGYSGRISGEPPDQVGPRKLAHILLGHVPNTFVLTPAQRDYLEPAATAWVRWSAARRELGEAGTTVLMEQLPRVLSRFGEAYDDLVECGSVAVAREKGVYRIEGKEYVMRDGDVVEILPPGALPLKTTASSPCWTPPRPPVPHTPASGSTSTALAAPRETVAPNLLGISYSDLGDLNHDGRVDLVAAPFGDSGWHVCGVSR